MKTILNLAFLLAWLAIAQSNSQTWKELMDSVKFYNEKQDFVNSIFWGEKAIEKAKAALGDLDTTIADIASTLTYFNWSLGKYEAALIWARLDSTIRVHSQSREHPHYRITLLNLGAQYVNLGRYEEAEKSNIESLNLARKLYNGDHPDLAQSINNMAMYYNGRGNYSDAEPLFKEALEMYRRIFKGDHPDLASSINSMALYYYGRGNYKNAEPLLKEALEMRRRLYTGDHPYLAQSINNMAMYYNARGNYKNSEPLLKESLEMSRRLYKGDHRELAQSINNMAEIYSRIGKYGEAEPLLKESLEMSRHLYKDDHQQLAKSINNMAYFYSACGNYNEAEPLLKEALEMRRRLYKGDHRELAQSINNMSALYCIMGRYAEAEPLLKESLEMRRRLYKECHPDLAESINNMASFYDRRGNYKDAELLYKEALEMSRHIFKGDHPDLANSINSMAVFFDDRGNYTEAEPLYKEALEMIKRIFKDDHPDLAMSINNMANFYKGRGNYKDAEPLYIEALEMSRRIFKGDHPDLAASINNIANFYDVRGNYKDAELLYKEAMEMYRRIFKGDHPDLARSINNMALFQNAKCNYKDAEPLLKEALEMYRRIFKGDHPDLAMSINNMAYFYHGRGNYKDAEPLYKESLEMRRHIFNDNHPDVTNSLINLAYCFQSQDRFYEAEKLFLESYNSMMKHIQTQFPYMNENQKIQFWSTKSGIINSFYRFASIYNKQKPEISQQMADITLATKGIVHNSTKKAFESVRETKRLFEDWQNTRQFWLHLVQNPQKAKKMGVNVDSVEKEASRLEAEISKQSSQFKKTFDTSRVRWQDVQKSLGMDEAAIEIVRFTDLNEKRDSGFVKYSFIILKQDSKYPELVVLENGGELEGRYIKKYRDILETEKKKTGGKSLLKIEGYPQEEYELYNAFWQKAQEKLGGIERVYVSLDGVYNQFNLNTLRNPATNKYLLEELDIRILTSTRDLAGRNPLCPRLKMVDMSAALFANPKFNLRQEVKSSKTQLQLPREIMPEGLLSGALAKMAVKGIEPLPGTKIEVEKVSSDFEKNGLKADKYLEATAMKSKLMTIKDPKILHIATHGLFLKDIEYLKEDPGLEERRYYENPLLKSMLLLSGAENTLRGDPVSEDDDGILTAYEVMNMDLDHTELVVLSACETGLGEIKNGEGVYGLQRAFQTAGAKSIIMSLWKVSDAATQELMTSFYSKWLSGKEKREAFREAQMELKQKYPGFYYWGAFVMVGE